jgi:hypothetical protein
MWLARLVALALAILVLANGPAHASETGRGDRLWVGKSNGSYLTLAEARRATRREVHRIVREQEEGVYRFGIKWCRRRSPTRVGCRYEIDIAGPEGDARCWGGARVIEQAGNRHYVRAWRDCLVNTN